MYEWEDESRCRFWANLWRTAPPETLQLHPAGSSDDDKVSNNEDYEAMDSVSVVAASRTKEVVSRPRLGVDNTRTTPSDITIPINSLEVLTHVPGAMDPPPPVTRVPHGAVLFILPPRPAVATDAVADPSTTGCGFDSRQTWIILISGICIQALIAKLKSTLTESEWTDAWQILMDECQVPVAEPL
jgi:hypothetical protein